MAEEQHEKVFVVKYFGKGSDVDAETIKRALLDSCAYLYEHKLEVVETGSWR